MPDTVLTRDGPVSVPLDYSVPQSGELIPLTVRAAIDGTAAASAFYAVVQVLAPSGRVMFSARSDSIAAGGSADVSWFPGVAQLPGAISPNTGGTWQPYTPTWAETSGVQPSLGNGSLSGSYFQLGQLVVARIVLDCGTTTTFGNAGGVWTFSLPVPALAQFFSFGMSSETADATAGDIITWGYAADTAHMAGWGYGPGTAGKLVQFLNSAQPTAWVASASTHIRLASMYEAA